MNRKIYYFFFLFLTISNITVNNSETTVQKQCSETTRSVVKEIGRFGTPVYSLDRAGNSGSMSWNTKRCL